MECAAGAPTTVRRPRDDHGQPRAAPKNDGSPTSRQRVASGGAAPAVGDVKPPPPPGPPPGGGAMGPSLITIGPGLGDLGPPPVGDVAAAARGSPSFVVAAAVSPPPPASPSSGTSSPYVSSAAASLSLRPAASIAARSCSAPKEHSVARKTEWVS